MAMNSTKGGMSLDEVVDGLASYTADIDREDMTYRRGLQTAESRKLRDQ